MWGVLRQHQAGKALRRRLRARVGVLRRHRLEYEGDAWVMLVWAAQAWVVEAKGCLTPLELQCKLGFCSAYQSVYMPSVCACLCEGAEHFVTMVRNQLGEDHLPIPINHCHRKPRINVGCMTAWVLLTVLVVGPLTVHAQSNTRLLLGSGSGVAGHPGFAFGPFTGLAMNENREVVFLSALRSPRTEIRAVIESSGVSFTVPAFQGLLSPVPKATFDSFSAPSLNDAGVLAFTATIKDRQENPTTSVIRMENLKPRALATTGDAVPGHPDSTFEEFSAPLITSEGSVVFGARWGGANRGTGLMLWTPRGLEPVELPAGLTLSPGDLLEPFFFSRDEAVFVRRGTSLPAAREQFFRAVATRTFQELSPPPDPADTVQVLAPRPGEAPVQMLLVLAESGKTQTVLLAGDPSQPVMAKVLPGQPAPRPLAYVEAQTTGARGSIIFAATPMDVPNDLALYCYCDGELDRLTTPEEFMPITQTAPGKPIFSLTGDSQHTVAFIAPNTAGEGAAIYVTSVPQP